MDRIKSLIVSCLLCFSLQACLQSPQQKEAILMTGASQMDTYIPALEGKRIALVANHTSLLGNTHLADTLLSRNINIVKVFAPEHGFRGSADAGEYVKDGTDVQTGVPIVSLYGSNKKPSQESLQNIDLVLFDLQDVGARFYTYIYTLTYVMEAAAEAGIPVMVLDRPNPNGFYVDGPVMEEEHTSFIGMHPVPIVYGMTIGEYGRMVNGEYWLSDSLQCDLTVIPLKNYDRKMLYKLPVKPSPNLPNWQSIYLYPSLCLFEGTVMSVGRGTDHPFTIYGHPDFMIGSYTFIPESKAGAKHPKLEGDTCFGQNLTGYAESYRKISHHINLQWLINGYQVLGMDSSFFNSYFEKLSGTDELRKQISIQMSEYDIRESWQPGLQKFKKIRKKYLIYEDFE